MRLSIPRPATAFALLAALLLALLPLSAASAEPVAEAGDVTIERLGGENRVETAIEISQSVFDAAPTVVLARADDYADALVGATLAAELGGPILLTDRSSLSAGIADELARLGAQEVVLLGGPAAIEPSVEDELDGYDVRRVFGDNRFGTAAAVAAELPPTGTVFIAEGQNADPNRGWPDALSVAPYAAFVGNPILLVTADAVPAETAEALAALAPEELVIVGGTAAVSQAVEDELITLTGLDPAAGAVRRLAGADRYGTSAAIYDEAVTRGMDPVRKWLATGRNFPDALAAGPAVAAAGQTFLLVDGNSLAGSPDPAARLPVDIDLIQVVTVLGLTAAISDTVVTELDQLLTAASTVPAAEFCLTVLHSNDGESQFVSAGAGLEEFGGVARFASLVAQERNRALEDADDGCAERGVLTVNGGDSFLAGTEFAASLEKGVPFYDSIALDYIGYDVQGLGNHDFDFGPEVTADFIEGFGDATFVSANLDVSGEPDLQALAADGTIVPSTIIDAGAREIGVIGIITPDLPNISSPRNVQVSSDLVGAVDTQVAALRDGGADRIVLISHLQGIPFDLELIPQLSGVDVVVSAGGSEVLALPGELLVPGDEQNIFGSYPYATVDQVGRSVPLVTTSGDYRYLGRLEARFGAAGDQVLVEPFSSRVLRVNSTALPYGVEPDQFIQTNVVDPVLEFQEDLAANVIGTSEVPLDGTRTSVRSVETNLGDLVADSQIAIAQERAVEFGLDPDAKYVGIQNGGGIRNNTVIPAGDITELDTFDIVPFPNFVAVFPGIVPDELKLLLENGYAEIGGGRFAQIGGMSVVVDPDAPVGSRVVSVTLDDGTAVVVRGVAQPTSADTTVSVATIDFLARGGDNYPFPTDREFTVIGASYQQALADFIVTNLAGVITGAAYPAGGEGRIVFQP